MRQIKAAKTEITNKKHRFIGREQELKRIQEAANSGEASILIVYGRRRVGKTELIEHSLAKRNLVKMEGVEGGDQATQIDRVLWIIVPDGRAAADHQK